MVLVPTAVILSRVMAVGFFQNVSRPVHCCIRHGSYLNHRQKFGKKSLVTTWVV
jgi:hypothetical protein